MAGISVDYDPGLCPACPAGTSGRSAGSNTVLVDSLGGADLQTILVAHFDCGEIFCDPVVYNRINRWALFYCEIRFK